MSVTNESFSLQVFLVTVTWDERPRRAKWITVLIFALLFHAILAVLYVVVLPHFVGFEATLLLGVAIIWFTLGSEDAQ